MNQPVILDSGSHSINAGSSAVTRRHCSIARWFEFTAGCDTGRLSNALRRRLERAVLFLSLLSVLTMKIVADQSSSKLEATIQVNASRRNQTRRIRQTGWYQSITGKLQ